MSNEAETSLVLAEGRVRDSSTTLGMTQWKPLVGGFPNRPEASPSGTGKANSRTFLGSSALYLRAYSPTHSSDLSTTLCALCSVRCLSGSKDLRWDSARYRPFSSSSDSAASDGGSYNAAAAKRFGFVARRGRRSLAEGIRSEIGVLLDQQNGNSQGLINLGDFLENGFHQNRCDTERRLIQHQTSRFAHEGAANREHLLFTAGKRPRDLPFSLL